MHARLICASLLALCLIAPAIRAQNDSPPPAVPPELRQTIEQSYPDLFQLYQNLHAHPELSFQEEQTAQQLAGQLNDLGYDVTTQVGGHGVVAILENGKGKTLLLRADMDALPIHEQTGLAYASRESATDDKGNSVPVMHACGHDIHMTCLIGAAQVLAKHRDRWTGTLILIAQPAEERGAGAVAMLQDGLFTRFPEPDFCVAQHVTPELPAGSIGWTSGYALANVDSVDITVHGVGGHGAYPHAAKDPIVLASQIVLALQTIVSRQIPPIEPAVVTVGSIHGGTKHNIIPDKVALQLTIRSYSDSVRQNILQAIERITRGLGLAAGLAEEQLPTVSVGDDYTPATYNDPELTERLVDRLRHWIGPDNIHKREPVMGGEDFGQYGRTESRIPICMLWLGAMNRDAIRAHKEEGKPLPSLHSPFFAPDPKPTITTGVSALTAAALELLGGGKSTR